MLFTCPAPIARIVASFIQRQRPGLRALPQQSHWHLGFTSPAARHFASQVAQNNSSMLSGEDVVLANVTGGVGTVLLNRPRALNSLNTEMVEKLLQVYKAWDAPNSPVNCILLKGAGGKAFCAGGDVKSVVLDSMAGNVGPPVDFFHAEYVADYAVATVRKPHIAVLDGIVMGGGAGVSMHGPFRVATENTLFAMPECAIGLFPDIGSSHFLQRLPGAMGLYLALTGARLQGMEVLEAGLATHYIPAYALEGLIPELQQLGTQARDLSRVDAVLNKLQAAAGLPGPTGLLDKLPAINLAFANKKSMEEVAGALQALAPQHAVCREAVQMLSNGSPLSQKVTLRLMQQMAHHKLEHCLATDFRLAVNFSLGKGDFFEGVRAILIDKTKPPMWKYQTLQEVPDSAVQQMFELPDGFTDLSVSNILQAAASKL